ncbi:MAG: transglutaminase-like domain-containing protein [Candidatus Omnitrophica bacterium]|nr:transglutaminase-like domain-containing protein [Candidatus Omnitrophota bacterium]
MADDPAFQTNFPALLKLLADDDPNIVASARAKLLEYGEQAIAPLEAALKKEKDPALQKKIEQTIREIRLETVTQEWQGFSSLPDDKLDLEKGVFLLAKVSYPGMDAKGYGRRLDEIAHQVRSRIRPSSRLKTQLGILNDYLFKQQKFKGNWDDYFDPENSFLNRVMDRKLGIPISLSVLYLLIANRLKLPLKGVGIPGHFMLKYEGEGGEVYLDAFNEGRFLTRSECIQFIVEAGYPYQPEFMKGVGDREILARMLRNLILIYIDRQDELMERVFTRFLNHLTPVDDSDSMGGATGLVSEETPEDPFE